MTNTEAPLPFPLSVGDYVHHYTPAFDSLDEWCKVTAFDLAVARVELDDEYWVPMSELRQIV